MGFWSRLLHRKSGGSPGRDQYRDDRDNYHHVTDHHTNGHHHHNPVLGLFSPQLKSPPLRNRPPTPTGIDYTANFPPELLERIFREVCPHTADETYASNENAPLADRCFLCDTRDLAECARVKSDWNRVAYALLYRSVRLDTCHYCDLEDELVERRQKKKKFQDPTAIRLKLIADTVRGNPRIGALVHFFKLPILTRQDCQCFPDLARAVGAMPNLEYVDLPDSLYHGDPSCDILWMEIQRTCQNLARMQLCAGAESKFRNMQGVLWSRLRVLELQGLRVDVQTLRIGLGNLPCLEELTLSDMTTIDDQIFDQSPAVPIDFPIVRILSLENTPNITVHGLLTYLARPAVKLNFVNLSLSHSGVLVEQLHEVLAAAPLLETLSVVEEVSHSMPLKPIPPLHSSSLMNLHFEILSSEAGGLADMNFSESYYMYLSSCLTTHALPNLRNLYVRYNDFVDLLIMPPPTSVFGDSKNGGGAGNGTSPNLGSLPSNPFGLTHELSIYTKGADQQEWYTSVVSPTTTSPGSGMSDQEGYHTRSRSLAAMSGFGGLPPPPPLFGAGPGGLSGMEAGNRSSVVSLSGQPGQRALSVYGTSRPIGPQWGGEAVKSVVVANPEKAGFLVLPQEESENVNRYSFLSAPGTPDLGGVGANGTHNGFGKGAGGGDGGHRRHHSHHHTYHGGSTSLGVVSPPPRKKKSAIDLWR